MDDHTTDHSTEDRSTSPGTPSSRPAPSRREIRPARLALVGVALVLLVWFALANLQGVRIRFWVSSAHAPLIVVIVISGFLGAAASGSWSWLRRRRRAGGSGG